MLYILNVAVFAENKNEKKKEKNKGFYGCTVADTSIVAVCVNDESAPV